MKLVFLIPDLKKYELVKAYSFDSRYLSDEGMGEFRKIYQPVMQKINNAFFIVTFEDEESSDQSALSLSSLSTDFTNKFNCKVLVNEASAYFNERLFPKVNQFERELRRFIYFKQAYYLSVLEKRKTTVTDEDKNDLLIEIDIIKSLFDNSGNGKKKNTKKQLEDMDYYGIYKLLFVDQSFCESIQKRFFPNENGKTNVILVRKQEYLDFIKDKNEKILWDVLSDGRLSIIKDNFESIQDIRNGVMHAHNIDYTTYNNAVKLLDDALKSLQDELQQFTEDPAIWSLHRDTSAYLDVSRALRGVFPTREQLFHPGYICSFCQNEIESIDDAEIDHIIPLCRGGSSDISNLQLLHKRCNRKKGSSTYIPNVK